MQRTRRRRRHEVPAKLPPTELPKSATLEAARTWRFVEATPIRYTPFKPRDARKKVVSEPRADPDEAEVFAAVELLLRGSDEAAHQIINPGLPSEIHPARLPPPPPDTSLADAEWAHWIELQRLAARYRLHTRANDFKHEHQFAVDKATRRLADYALLLDPNSDADPERYASTFHVRPKVAPPGPEKHDRSLRVARPEMIQRKADAFRARNQWPRGARVVGPGAGTPHTPLPPADNYGAVALRSYLAENGLPPARFIS
eukprot:m.8029 g.8029  ORF g.8029 m.8029 type:complete len:258 (+) comp4014_c0_seq2:180-953(+)